MVLNYCSNCGQRINQREKYCSHCGQKLFEKENDNLTNRVNSIKDQKSKISIPILNALKSKKGLVTIGIVIVAFIIFLSIGLGKQSPSNVAKEFIEYTQEENYDGAKELWSQSGIDYMLAQLGDESWINQNMENFTHRTDGDLIEFEITKEEKVDNEMTSVYANFVFDNGRQEEAQLAMIKEDGKWKVFAFNTY